MNKPEVKTGLNSYSYSWPELDIRVEVERYTDDGIAELGFWHDNDDGKVLLHYARLNLLSTPSCNQLVKRLTKNMKADWDTILTYITSLTLEASRRGEPVVPVGIKPETMKVEYQLSPIIEKNQPTTIYAPGSSCKSLVGDYIAVLVQFNVVGITDSRYSWMPAAGNVLYLDWEASKEDHARRVWAIKQGLGIDSEETFLYRFCSQPLVSDIYSIQSLVFENQIDLVIVDSQMAASGYGPDQAQMASQFYNALRSLRCTTLTFDHVSKEDWKSGHNPVGPYGSVVKYNRSRSQFEIKKSQAAGDEYLELALIHRKHNEGKLQKAIGIRINFNENADGQLKKIIFSACDVGDNPDLSEVLTLRERLTSILKGGSMTVKELGEELDKPEGTVRMELNRKTNKGIYVKKGNEWGLLDSDHV